ncbi:hypothetical protein Dimus_015676 [Dionaea muscipula]
MVSLRFPFSLSPSPHPTSATSSRRNFRPAAAAFSVAAAAAGTAAAGIALYQGAKIQVLPFLVNTLNPIFSNILIPNSSSLWASVSFSDNPPPIVDSRTGSSFPSVINSSQRLLGVGLRRKSVLGLKNIDVYAFGVYADESDVKKYVNEKYRKLSIQELKATKNFHEDLIESDVSLTIRLQIVYGKLGIRSVRSAFEESIRSRLQKFGGPDNKELLHRFTAQFKDDYKIPKGSVIELSRDNGHVLRTRIDGKEIGSIQSKVLCRSVLDLYIGEHPFDEVAKEDVLNNMASVLDSQED